MKGTPMGRRSRWLGIADRVGLRAIPAGTWEAVQGRFTKLTTPEVTPMWDYTGQATVDLGANGNAPLVVFSASGTATAQIGPQGVGERWTLSQCSVSTNKGQLGSTSTCVVYTGP